MIRSVALIFRRGYYVSLEGLVNQLSNAHNLKKILRAGSRLYNIALSHQRERSYEKKIREM
jgi:hypothetical protein